MKPSSKALLSLLLVLTIFTAASPAQAQKISAWWKRSSKALWGQSLQKAFAAPQLRQISFATPQRSRLLPTVISTTPNNLLYSKIQKSNLFCKQEKDLILNKTLSPQERLGIITLLHDRNALLADYARNSFPDEQIVREDAFLRHQDRLQSVLTELEDFYIIHDAQMGSLSKEWQGSPFLDDQIQLLRETPKQPQFHVLNAREVEIFPTLTHEEQVAFTTQLIEKQQSIINHFLNTPLEKILPGHASSYYRARIRQKYFKTLLSVLERKPVQRNSIIMRVPEKINIDFLPYAKKSMTDAQRLGYLYFHNDAVAESIASSQAPAVVTGMQPILQEELLRHIRVYNPYAMAQAFDIPYEKALSLRDYDRKKLFFNEDFIAYIDNSSSKELAETLPQHIEKVQQELAALRHTTPNPENLDFYVNYYRLSAKAGFLQSLLSVAKTNLKYNIKP